jgi:hypothetical protein
MVFIVEALGFERVVGHSPRVVSGEGLTTLRTGLH